MIRPAERRDVPTIHALIRELAEYKREPARDFYRSLGAEPMEESTVWRLTDASLDGVAAD